MTDTPTDAAPRLGRVGTFVDDTVRDLQGRFLRERQDSAAVAALARLRRAVGKPPGAVMDVLEFTYHPDLSPGADDEPTIAEHAAHLAITLFAAHQQSRGEGMHRRGRGLGTALRGLAAGPEADIPDPIARRFRMLSTADSLNELAHHLRGVVQLLRADGAALDYGRLADQLLRWQRGGRDQVRMTWGREFYRQNRATAKTDFPDTANDQETA